MLADGPRHVGRGGLGVKPGLLELAVHEAEAP